MNDNNNSLYPNPTNNNSRKRFCKKVEIKIEAEVMSDWQKKDFSMGFQTNKVKRGK